MLFSVLLPAPEYHTSNRAMKIVLRLVAVLILLAMLVGCGATAPKQPAPTEYKEVTVKVPKNLTAQLKPNRPIAPEKYLAMTLDDREDYLVMYTQHQMAVINVLNERLRTIDKLYGDKP